MTSSRSPTRVAVAGGVVLVATTCLYFWTHDTSQLRSLDDMQTFRGSGANVIVLSNGTSPAPSSDAGEQSTIGTDWTWPDWNAMLCAYAPDAPPQRIGAPTPDGAKYRLFAEPSAESRAHNWSAHITHALSVSAECLESFVRTGSPCKSEDVSQDSLFDFVWCVQDGGEQTSLIRSAGHGPTGVRFCIDRRSSHTRRRQCRLAQSHTRTRQLN